MPVVDSDVGAVVPEEPVYEGVVPVYGGSVPVFDGAVTVDTDEPDEFAVVLAVAFADVLSGFASVGTVVTFDAAVSADVAGAVSADVSGAVSGTVSGTVSG